jgi:MFS family permease
LRAWGAVLILLALYTLAHIDRNVINLVVVPIQREFGLDVFSMSLLMGPAFGLCYSVSSVAIAWLVDRVSRRAVIFAGVLVWALAAAGTGLAQSFEALFAARMLVGVGEAALLPAAYVLIADMFPRHRLSLALSILSMGALGGIAVGYVLGGWLVESESLIEGMSPWRAIFVVTALPCFAIVGLLFLIPERASPVAKPGISTQARVRLLPFLRRQWKVALAVLGGPGLISLCTASLVAWLPTFISREYGWSMAQAGATLGLMILGVSSCGKLVAAWIVDHLVARGVGNAPLRYLFGGLAIAMPFSIASFFVQGAPAFLMLIGTWFFLASPVGGYGAAAVQMISPVELRGQMSGLFVFSNNVLGLGIGPAAVGLIADRLGGIHLLGEGLALLIAAVAPVGLIIIATGLGPMRRWIDEGSRPDAED